MTEFQISIVTELNSDRLNYCLEYLFSDIKNVHWSIHLPTDKITADLYIKYGGRGSENYQLWIPSSDYLKPGFINTRLELTALVFENLFISIDDHRSACEFDFIGAIFFFLSRMEEYEYESSDPYHRFSAFDSTLHRIEMDFTAVVDRWKREWHEVLLNFLPELQMRSKLPTVEATCDVDRVFAYKGKNWLQLIGGGMKEALQFKFDHLLTRLKWAVGKSKDPFDTLDILLERAGECNSSLCCFFLCPEEVLHSEDRGGELLKGLSARWFESYKTRVIPGLHPSLSAGDNSDRIVGEKELLEGLWNQTIKNSRQHYLRMSLPDTYRALLKCGIKRDYSMGFYDQPGFRAGTSRPFFWYDIENEVKTDLIIHPLVLMDVSLKKYLALERGQAIEIIEILLREIKDTNGIFSYLWHNSSISDLDGWAGWRSVLDELIVRANEILELPKQ